MSSAAGARDGHRSVRPRGTIATLMVQVQAGRRGATVPARAGHVYCGRVTLDGRLGCRNEPSTTGARPLPTWASMRCSRRSPRSRGASSPGLAIGSGDDAAVWSPEPGRDLAISQDALVEGVDFRRSWISPRRLGARALAVALSDLAGMGARPLWCAATLCAPASTNFEDVLEIQRGLCAAAAAAGCAVVGGDVSAIDGPLVIDVSVGGMLAARRGAASRSAAIPATWWWSPERSVERRPDCACSSTAAPTCPARSEPGSTPSSRRSHGSPRGCS